MEILMIVDRVPVEEAWRIGPVNVVLPRKGLLAEARAIATKIAGNGPLAVQAVKRAVRRSDGVPLRDALAIESEVGGPVFASNDAVEGPRAFMEKRAPNFTGT